MQYKIKTMSESTPNKDPNGASNPDSPKNRLLRLVVGIVVISLGIAIFSISSDLYKKAEEKDAEEKALREEKIRELTEPDSTATATENIDNSL